LQHRRPSTRPQLNIRRLQSQVPDAINDSGIMAGISYTVEGGFGTIALVIGAGAGGTILPPGNSGDSTTSINSSNVIGGRSGGKPVLWVPNP
jgi:hypothetical protein